MKIAKLHDGEELYFPPDMDDGEMDSRVQKYLARGSEQSQVGEQAPADNGSPLMQAMLSFYNDSIMKDKQSAATRDEEKAQFRQSDAQQRMQETLQKVAAIEGLAEAFGQAMEDAAKRAAQPIADVAANVAKVAENADRLDDVVKAVNNLSQTIVETMSALTTLLRAPREIYRDADGAPAGVKLKVKGD